MKIGVSSHNFKKITAHPGRARHFFVFNEEGEALVESRLELSNEQTLHNYRGGGRACVSEGAPVVNEARHPIQDFDVLITGSCCENFRGRMDRLGVKVISTTETDPRVAATAVLKGQPLPEAPSHSHHGHHHD